MRTINSNNDNEMEMDLSTSFLRRLMKPVWIQNAIFPYSGRFILLGY